MTSEKVQSGKIDIKDKIAGICFSFQDALDSSTRYADSKSLTCLWLHKLCISTIRRFFSRLALRSYIFGRIA
jgi:hypothetical protein